MAMRLRMGIGLSRSRSAAGGVSLTPTVTTDTIAERGITWTLAAPAPVGQFAAGEYFAVGATVAATDPASAQISGSYPGGGAYTGRWAHGLMVNPGSNGGTGLSPTDNLQGLDSLDPETSGSNIGYSHALNRDPGLTGALSGECSLLKTRSLLSPNTHNRPKLDAASLLTLLNAIPPAGSFRRWSGSASKTPIFFTSDIDWSVLPAVALPSGATLPSAATILTTLGPFQFFSNNMLFTRGVHPATMQAEYDSSADIHAAMLFTMTSGVSASDRETVALRLIQAGLDLYDALEAGRRWGSSTTSFGGAMGWFKPLLVYAARLLRNAANTVERAKLIAWCDGTANRIFGTDYTTFPITRAQIEATPLDEASTAKLQPQGYPDWSENTREWGSKPSSTDYVSLSLSVAYRAQNDPAYQVSAMIARMLGGEATWNRPDFFEYADLTFDRQGLRSWPTNAYFPALNRLYLVDHFATNSPAYQSAVAPAVVRREARGLYAWIETDRNFDLSFQPAATDLTVTVDGSGVSLTSVTTATAGTQPTYEANEPLIRLTSATGVRAGQRVVCASLHPDTFVISVSGSDVLLSEWIPSGAAIGTGVSITFENVFVFGRSLVAVLPVPLTVSTQPVTIGYTAPGSGFVRALGGTGLATTAAAAATNRTGLLPDAPTERALAYSGPTQATRQYSGTPRLRAETIRRVRLSARWSLEAAMATNETILASQTGSTGSFRLYCPSANNARILLPGTGTAHRIDANGALTSAPLGTLLTLHAFLALDQTSHTAAKKCSLVWSGGGNAALGVGTTGDITGTATAALTTFLQEGLHAFAKGINGDAFHGSIREITIGWGDETLPLPADFSGAEFAHDADWGDNGEGPWGQNQLYYTGSLAEWNGGVPNRGSYGALSLSPKRFITAGDPDSGLATEFTAPP